MKIKVSEASGVVLDWLVAQCEGLKTPPYPGRGGFRQCWINVSPAGHDVFEPSTDWAQAGPIIDRERIGTGPVEDGSVFPDKWVAAKEDSPYFFGHTPLIAAMRCYVTSKLGDEVEVPEELLK